MGGRPAGRDEYPAGAGPTRRVHCDGLDDDCDGALPDDEADLDGDGGEMVRLAA